MNSWSQLHTITYNQWHLGDAIFSFTCIQKCSKIQTCVKFCGFLNFSNSPTRARLQMDEAHIEWPILVVWQRWPIQPTWDWWKEVAISQLQEPVQAGANPTLSDRLWCQYKMCHITKQLSLSRLNLVSW